MSTVGRGDRERSFDTVVSEAAKARGASSITDETDLYAYGFDSLAMTNLLLDLGDVLDFEITGDEMARCLTMTVVGELKAVVLAWSEV